MSRFCECGNRKTPGAEACDRCMFLDGVTLQDMILLDALRIRGGVATAEELEVDSGWSHRQILRALERLKDSGQGNGRVARLETGEENHFNMPVFVLTDARAPRMAEEPDPWGQLVLAAWVALCKHVRVELVISLGGGEVGQRCACCGHRELVAEQVGEVVDGDVGFVDEAANEQADSAGALHDVVGGAPVADRTPSAWTDEQAEPGDLAGVVVVMVDQVPFARP